MKNLLFLLFCVQLGSCSLQKNNKSGNVFFPQVSIENKLSHEDSNVINDFIDVELKKERYKNYKDSEVVVIEEALKKIKPISDYEFNLKYKESWGKFNTHWILDTLQLKKIKLELEKEEVYHWKTTDFKDIKVSLLKYEELRRIINSGDYANFPSKLIIYLSKPLFIDKNNAFISFEAGNGQLGFNSINHFTVLMRKINNKWEQIEHFEDGVFN